MPNTLKLLRILDSPKPQLPYSAQLCMADVLQELFLKHFGVQAESVDPLRPHASNRRIFRLRGGSHTAIGILNPDFRENQAFIGFTRHFRSKGLAVPEVYLDDLSRGAYLEEDLGDMTLFDALSAARGGSDEIPLEIEAYYRAAVETLPRFQIEAGATLNYDLCYPTKRYDRRAMLWDMHYFRDNFLRRTQVRWTHSLLEKDFNLLADFLEEAGAEYFMYRDFQARNIMLHHGKVHFIDYWEGRRGPLQYDLVSILYQSRALLPTELRQRLMLAYLAQVEKLLPTFNRAHFLKFVYGFVFIRLMQVLGTYAEKGLGEKKEYFIASIPYAIRNLKVLLESPTLPVHVKSLTDVCEQLVSSYGQRDGNPFQERLRVNVYSFSYRHGLPVESAEHGGGFIFDCRCIPNPGRELAYRDLNGLDQPVVEYLDRREEMQRYLASVYSLIDQAVESYLARGFLSLTACFGCTGGQHRSVYSAEKVARHVREKYQVVVETKHLQLAAGVF